MHPQRRLTIMISYCTCGWRVMHEHATTIDCPQCSRTIVCDGEQRPASQSAPLDQWPTWATAIAKMKSDADTGVGDTVARYAAMIGGEAFKLASKALGIPCGCTERQERWNKLYPYEA